MKDIVEFLSNKKYIFKKLHPIEIKLLGSRKKIEIFEGIDTKSNYIAIFKVDQKSRFVTKNSKEIEELLEKLIKLQQHNYKKRILLISSPLCSKAKKYLEELKWKIYENRLKAEG